MSRARKRPPVAEPEEGSPADWFARGYRQGVSDGAGAATRELAVLRTHVDPLVQLTASLAGQLNTLITEMNKRWGRAQYGTGDRWQAHPMYLLGAQLFREMDAHDRCAPAPVAPKCSRRRKANARPTAPPSEPGPSLTVGEGEPAAEPELAPEAEARRAAGRAWRA